MDLSKHTDEQLHNAQNALQDMLSAHTNRQAQHKKIKEHNAVNPAFLEYVKSVNEEIEKRKKS